MSSLVEGTSGLYKSDLDNFLKELRKAGGDITGMFESPEVSGTVAAQEQRQGTIAGNEAAKVKKVKDAETIEKFNDNNTTKTKAEDLTKRIEGLSYKGSEVISVEKIGWGSGGGKYTIHLQDENGKKTTIKQGGNKGTKILEEMIAGEPEVNNDPLGIRNPK
jgi:hypothetical protein